LAASVGKNRAPPLPRAIAPSWLRASGKSRARPSEEERADLLFLSERRRRRRRLDVRAADLQEKMAEQRFSVPPDPTKTAATQRTSQRAERAIKHSAICASSR
jgi:hypothetical protein